MLKEKDIISILKKGFTDSFKLRLIKPGVFQVFLPYYHEDGDMIDIYLQEVEGKVFLNDFGQTLMRLSYTADIDSGTRKKVFDTILYSYNVEYNNGKLFIEVFEMENLFVSIMEFIAVITKISDISYLKQERAKSMFYEYFDNFIIQDLSKQLKIKIEKDFSPSFDNKKEYIAPYAIKDNVSKPILFFPILNDDKCKDTIMTLLYYKNNHFDSNSIGVFSDFDEISTKNSGKVIDLLDRPLSNFESNKSKIISYTGEIIS